MIRKKVDFVCLCLHSWFSLILEKILYKNMDFFVFNYIRQKEKNRWFDCQININNNVYKKDNNKSLKLKELFNHSIDRVA